MMPVRRCRAMVLTLALLALASVLMSLFLAVITTPSITSSMNGSRLRPMSGFWLRTLLHTAGLHAAATRFGEWMRFLRQSKAVARSLFRPLLRFFSLSVALGLVFALFFLAPFSRAFAIDIDGQSRITVWTPPSASYFQSAGFSSVYYRAQFVHLYCGNDGDCNIGRIDVPSGVAHSGDVLAVTIQPYGAYSTEGYTANSGLLYEMLTWKAYGIEGRSWFLGVNGTTAYFKCTSDSGCGVGNLAAIRNTTYSTMQFVLTTFIISGSASASQELASQELQKSDEFQAMNNSGSQQQAGLESAQFKNQSQSLISSLKTIANTSASSCDVSSVVHGMPLQFDFCSQPRPAFLGPLVAIPVGVVSLLLSIHLIRTIFREIESFRPKGS